MTAPQAAETFACHKISGGVASGEVLFSQDDICFYLCDPETGKVIEDGHCLHGVSVSGKILVFPSGKGSSVVQTDGLYQLAMRGNAPKAVVVQHPDTVLVATCIILDVPMVDRVEAAFYERVKTGDAVRLDASSGVIQLIGRA
ncbi:DUF126 domain-containing protein [Kyrpidia sp.]|uniref:aconitase X swivel domain-containing protein n=1 Tax=Kyrpidia sp. TaxID=2073077 RepID=UPI0017AA3435|nr:DUF126 domain-containing protein [Kyrpidia sp.]MCL6577302.1 DUF126 domain-containing protein [Kyrpidia sp.]HHY67637.1 DUF126 domain-containing protein [Alicyclobacillus sp.]